MASRSATCRYPLIDEVALSGLPRVTVRPIRADDRGLLDSFFRALTPQSRYARFMTHWREVPLPLLDRLAAIDGCRHFAIVAGTFDDAGQETLIGEARFVLANDNPQQCEFALAIADHWHRKGLGSIMLSKIEVQAALRGVRVMTGETLASNAAMHQTARRAGYSLTLVSGLVKIEKSVKQEP